MYTIYLLKSPPETEKLPQINADLRKSALIRASFSVLLLILLCVNAATAQTNVRDRVMIAIANPGQIKVDAELSTPVDSWSFRNAYAGVLDIAKRIEDFRAVDADVQKVAVGEYRSARKSRRISYTVKFLKPTLAEISHFSWLVDDRGVLMLADLISLEVHSLSAAFSLPESWTVESSFLCDANGHYEVVEPEKAVFIEDAHFVKLQTRSKECHSISFSVAPGHSKTPPC